VKTNVRARSAYRQERLSFGTLRERVGAASRREEKKKREVFTYNLGLLYGYTY